MCVTYDELFSFVMMICTIITLLYINKDQKITALGKG